jgi:hypothetical protein
MNNLDRYHNEKEYRELYIKKATENKKQHRIINRYNHYKKLSEDIEYLQECENNGLRIRNCPEEFLEKISQSLEMLQIKHRIKCLRNRNFPEKLLQAV